MSDKSSARDATKWKQKYRDNLDLLDKKQSDWQSLEAILKKAVLRLSITAEGQNKSIDRHLQDIRSIIKKQVDILRLDNKLDAISSLLIKLDDNKATEDIKIVTTLTQLLKNTHFPASADKQKNKLIKKLAKSSDKNSDNFIKEVQALIDKSVNPQAASETKNSSAGFLGKLFNSEQDQQNNTSGEIVTDNQSVATSVSRMAKALPWPDKLRKDARKIIGKLSKANNHDAEKHLDNLIKLIDKWQKVDSQSKQSDIINIDFDDDESSTSNKQEKYTAATPPSNNQNKLNENNEQPSSHKVLLRLLEQLTVPSELQAEYVSLKQRLGEESATTNWKQLLKDVSQLINSLRTQMQEEKQEFENFLQQITGRLQEMDAFLETETASLNDAELASENFDVAVSAQVQDIQDDVNTTNDLNELKNKVEKRLNVVAEHIKEYRTIEQERFNSAQQNVKTMQTRLVTLEQETVDLKKSMLVNSKLALCDALTNVPNRLAYEKKISDEISRCIRYGTQLSIAVWDIDLFKKVNDTYGHNVGDKVLKAVAHILDERIRESDFIARYGGEEFVMLLPGVNEDEAINLTDVLRQKISDCRFNHKGEIIRVTVSCGISHFIENDDRETLFERADKALYSAKDNGRNQCVLATSLTE